MLNFLNGTHKCFFADHLAQQRLPGADKVYVNCHYEIQLRNVGYVTECFDILFVLLQTFNEQALKY